MSIIAQVDGSGTAVATSEKTPMHPFGTHSIACMRERNEDLLRRLGLRIRSGRQRWY